MSSDDDVTQRFSRRVSDYVRYRPGYPDAIASALRRRVGYHPAQVVADIGSGTGISTRYFLDRGNLVYAVEPNRDMRSAAEEWLGSYSKFRSVEGRAERTTLDSESIDLVVAAQSFHWFDARETRREFERILRPGGAVALLWNERKVEATPFLQAYERLLLELSDEYRRVSQRAIASERSLQHFFGAELWGSEEFTNRQAFDRRGLIGRALSSSYVPLPDDARHEPFVAALHRLFDEHADSGRVWFEYATRLVWGRLRA